METHPVNTKSNGAFPSSYRLRGQKDISSVFRKGKKVYTRCFSVRWLENSVGHARFCIRVGKKVSRKAVRRNQIKRWLREWLRFHKHEFPPVDLIISWKKECDDTNFEKLQLECHTLLNILKKKYQTSQ